MNKKFLDIPVEVKFLAEDSVKNTVDIEGYGSVFGVKDSYGDVVERGAFNESLDKNGMPHMLWQHNADQPIGVWKEVREDSVGLYMRGQILTDVQAGKEAASLIKNGAIKGLSIGFITEADEIDRATNLRKLKRVNLLEVSLVTFPANKLANVTAWKNDLPKTEREFEKFLRTVGFGRTQSKAITSDGFKAFMAMQRDADSDGAEVVQRDADMDKINSDLKTLLTTLTTLKERLHNERGSKTND